MPNLLEVIRDISDAILASQAGGGSSDCGCPAETVYPHPTPPGEPPTPFIGDDIEPTTLSSGSDICRSAYATYLLYRQWMYGLAELADIGGLSLAGVSSIIGIGGGAGATTIYFRLTTAVLGFAFAAALAIWTALGWGSGTLLRQWIDSIAEDAFVCAWLENYSGAFDIVPPAEINAILAAIHQVIHNQTHLPPMARHMLIMLMWDSKVVTLASHKGLNEIGEEVSWDLSHIDGTCSCEDGLDSVWTDLVQGLDCNHARFEAWVLHSDDDSIISAQQRMIQGLRCSDGANMQGANVDGIVLINGQTNRIKQYFSANEGDYFELYIEGWSGVGVSTQFHMYLDGVATYSNHCAGCNFSDTIVLENLTAGTHNIGFSGATGTNQNILHVAKLVKIPSP